MLNLILDFVLYGIWHPALEYVGLGLDSPLFDVIANLW